MADDILNLHVTDMLLRGAHPFPADIEDMLRRIHAHDPSLISNLDSRYFPGWMEGKGLNEGRAMLRAILAYVGRQTERA